MDDSQVSEARRMQVRAALLGKVTRATFTAIAAGLLALGAIVVLEIPFAPWLRSFGLWPTLTGSWVGTLERGNGQLSFVYLDLKGAMRRHGPNIWGTLRWCDDKGDTWEYPVSGRPDNWRGSRFHVDAGYVATNPVVSPATLRGTWTGKEIRASGPLVSRSGVATATATRMSRSVQTPEDARYVLRRGSAAQFTASCRTR